MTTSISSKAFEQKKTESPQKEEIIQTYVQNIYRIDAQIDMKE